MKDFIESTLINVESVTARAIANDQVELSINCARGSLTFRLIAKRGRVIRITDLRARDKRKRPLSLTQLRAAASA